MARFKRGSTELRVETPKQRLRPALIWDNGISYEILADFKDDQAAKRFCKVMVELLKGGKNGKAD